MLGTTTRERMSLETKTGLTSWDQTSKLVKILSFGRIMKSVGGMILETMEKFTKIVIIVKSLVNFPENVPKKGKSIINKKMHEYMC